MKNKWEAGWPGYIGVWLLAHFLANIPAVLVVTFWMQQEFVTLSGFYTVLIVAPIISYCMALPILITVYRWFKLINKRKVVPWMYGITILMGGVAIMQDRVALQAVDNSFWVLIISGTLIGIVIKCVGFHWFFVLRRGAKPFHAYSYPKNPTGETVYVEPKLRDIEAKDLDWLTTIYPSLNVVKRALITELKKGEVKADGYVYVINVNSQSLEIDEHHWDSFVQFIQNKYETLELGKDDNIEQFLVECRREWENRS